MISGKIFKKATALAVTAAMVVMSAVPAFADDINAGQETTQGGYTYTAPTKPMSVNKNIITATAHRAASPILGMLGVNAVCGFGMINGGAPKDLSDAETRTAMGIWGTSINSKPDPYYWNYFYNFYADENGLEKSDDALVNDNVAASPMQADKTLKEEYGNISVSLSKRPEVVVGCSTGNGADTDGYNDQLETIHNFSKDSEFYQAGDENYNPKLVSYQTTTIKQMIQSVHALADAITEVEKETGKTTRYGDVQNIASDYEDYVYGIIAYVREELAKKGLSQKKIAVVTAINGDGTYSIADNYTEAATSLVRAYEYAMTVTTNICDDYGTTVTKDQLLKADAILTFNNSNISQDKLLDSFGGSDYDGIIISNTPSAMYGVTMNSVENAMGYAYTIGSLYCDEIDINPVDLCAYFYEYFCHVTDRKGLATVIQTNFADTILPDGISAKLSDNYSSSKIARQLVLGKSYYNTYTNQFTDVECQKIGIDAWDTSSKNSSIGSGSTITGFYDVTIATAEGGSASANLTNTASGSTVIITVTPDAGYTATGVTVTDASGNAVTVTKNSDGTYSFTMPASAVTVTPAFAKADATQMAFNDVAAGSWYYDAVKYAVDNNIMAGTSATTFAPNAKLTRSMLAQILYNHAGKPAAAASTMSDVASGSWYASAVGWAAQKGIVTGYSDGTFKPGDSITREQLALMLYRYAGSPAVTGALDNYSDASSVSAYAQDAMKWATANGIITGNGSATTLDPKGNASRAQVAVMLMRYLENNKAA